MELTERIVNDIYLTDVRVGFAECGNDLLMKPADLLKQIVATAGTHYALRGVSHKMMYDNGQIFVLSRISLSIKRLPAYDDKITVTTWESEPQTVFAVRNFEVLSESGDVLASAVSNWVIIDPHTRSIRRPSSFDLCEYRPVAKDPVCPPCAKIKPYTQCDIWESRRVRPSDTDLNGHLHSAFYTYFVTDTLPDPYDTRIPKEISINYIREAKAGDILDLYIKQDEDVFTVTAMNGDSNCFTAEFKY